MKIVLMILCFVFQVFTIVHAWKHLPLSNTRKIICCILIFLLNWFGLGGYWIYFFVKRPTGYSVVTSREIPQDVVQEKEIVHDGRGGDEPGGDKVNRTLFNQAMSGANGKVLAECRERMLKMFIMGKDGNCNIGLLGAILTERDRAKRLEKMDNEVVIPVLGNNAAMYEAWWMACYDDIFDAMRASENGQQTSMLAAVWMDAQRGDLLLQRTKAYDFMENSREGVYEELTPNVEIPDSNGSMARGDVIVKSKKGGKKITIRTFYDTIKIELKKRNGKECYEVRGAYKYFNVGLSADRLVCMAEVLIAVPSILQFDRPEGVDRFDMEKYALPSLSKLSMK